MLHLYFPHRQFEWSDILYKLFWASGTPGVDYQVPDWQYLCAWTLQQWLACLITERYWDEILQPVAIWDMKDDNAQPTEEFGLSNYRQNLGVGRMQWSAYSLTNCRLVLCRLC